MHQTLHGRHSSSTGRDIQALQIPPFTEQASKYYEVQPALHNGGLIYPGCERLNDKCTHSPISISLSSSIPEISKLTKRLGSFSYHKRGAVRPTILQKPPTSMQRKGSRLCYEDCGIKWLHLRSRRGLSVLQGVVYGTMPPVNTGDIPSKDVVPLIYSLQRAYRGVAWKYRGL